MSLEIKPTSKWWYARIMIGGKRPLINLGVEVKGNRPKSLRVKGDLAFEKSRGHAERECQRLQSEFKQKRSAEEMVQKIYEIRTGGRVDSISLNQMFIVWRSLPRKRPLSDRYSDQAKSAFKRFSEFLDTKYPSVKEMADIQARMAFTFLKEEEMRGVASKTYNNTLILLRSTFNQLRKQAGLSENPFDGIPTKEEDTIFRKPFSAQELADIHKASEADEFIRPIIITATCTALRRGDCCLLKKTDVDVENRFVTVKTSKTGETVQIPMFPMLYEEVTRLPESSHKYLFPAQAKMYLENPDGITWRVKQVLKAAGFYDLVGNDSKDIEKHKNHKSKHSRNPQ